MTQKLIAAARTARARKGYRESLARDLEREAGRTLFYDMMDYALGNDTEGARRVAQTQERVVAASSRARAAGDPLNITRHAPVPKLSKGERKAKAKAERRQQETVVDPDGIFRKVEVRGMPLRSGLEEQQRRAVEDFSRDWEMALRSLRCRGFEPAIAGKPVFEHLHRVQAQDRLRNLEERLGRRDWTILVAMVIYGIGPAEAHRRGAPQHVIISAEIKRILNRVAAFYSPGVRHGDALLEACSAVIAEMEREVG